MLVGSVCPSPHKEDGNCYRDQDRGDDDVDPGEVRLSDDYHITGHLIYLHGGSVGILGCDIRSAHDDLQGDTAPSEHGGEGDRYGVPVQNSDEMFILLRS